MQWVEFGYIVVTRNKVIFVDTSSDDAVKWRWDFGDGSGSEFQHCIHYYANSGSYLVTLTAWDVNGLSETIQAQVNTNVADDIPPETTCPGEWRCVSRHPDGECRKWECSATDDPIITDPGNPPKPAPPFAIFTEKLYADRLVAFANKSLNYPTRFLWDFGDGQTSTVESPVHQYVAPGVYTAVLTAYNALGEHTSLQREVTVESLERKVDFSYVGSGLRVFFFNDSTIYGAMPLWDFGADQYSTLQNPECVFGAIGLYNVTLTIGSSSVTKEITVASGGSGGWTYIRQLIDNGETYGNRGIVVNDTLYCFNKGFSSLRIYDLDGNLLDTISTEFSAELDFSNVGYPAGSYTLGRYLEAITTDGSYLYLVSADGLSASLGIPVLIKLNLDGSLVSRSYAENETTGLSYCWPRNIAYLDGSLYVPGYENDFASSAYMFKFSAALVHDAEFGESYYGGKTLYQRGPGMDRDECIPVAGDADYYYAVSIYDSSMVEVQELRRYDKAWSYIDTLADGIVWHYLHAVGNYFHAKLGRYNKSGVLVDIPFTGALGDTGAFDSDYLALTADNNAYRRLTGDRLEAYSFTAADGSVLADYSMTPTSGAAPLTVAFFDESIGTIVLRLWNFGDGAASNELNPEHQFIVPGVYTVSLVVTGESGLTDEIIQAVTVTDGDEPPFDPVTSIVIRTTRYIYQVMFTLDRIDIFNLDGTAYGTFGEFGSGNGQFNEPRFLALADGIAFQERALLGGSGTIDLLLFVTDSGNNRVQSFSPEGVYSGQFGSYGSDNGEFNSPQGITTDGEYVYVVDSGNNRVQVFDLDGNFLFKWGSPGSGDGEFNNPVGIAMDERYVYVVDSGNNRIQIFSRYGEFVGKWGSYGTGENQFNAPRFIFVDTAFITIEDYGNSRNVVYPKKSVRATTNEATLTILNRLLGGAL